MNPLGSLLRRLTVPDLSGYGLPAPDGDGFSQYLRSKVIPIVDHGFVEAVRDGRITIVSAVQSFDGPEVRLDDGRTVRPDAIVAATGYRPDLEGILGDLAVLDDSGTPQVQGAHTVSGAPGLYFVGIGVQLSGQLRQIAREAEELSGSLARA
jgi:cation diffusion facilitator CzcD-associated flavoprotein CzcO